MIKLVEGLIKVESEIGSVDPGVLFDLIETGVTNCEFVIGPLCVLLEFEFVETVAPLLFEIIHFWKSFGSC